MTATQGFLHAALRSSSDCGRAVAAVNHFVHPRRPESKFVTMWVGVFDFDRKELCYVDAGHGYAILKKRDGTFIELDQGGGLPIGISADGEYVSETIPLEVGACVMIVSDGIIEQYGSAAGNESSASRKNFEVAGVKQSLSASSASLDPVADLFVAVITHAGTDKLADDATAVLVKW